MSADHCPACGNAWANHAGIAATCVRLRNAEAENKRLRADNEQLRAGLIEQGKESAKMQAELMDLRRKHG